MINRQNWLDVRQYLYHVEVMRQTDPETVKRTRGHLRHLLEWADSGLLSKARGLPGRTFPTYLMDVQLSPASIARCLGNARAFFTFARGEWPLRYHGVTGPWIDLLQPPRLARIDSQLREHQFWRLEDVLAIAGVSVETLRQERARVAVAMLYLSGMRADALASLPVSCVDLAAGQIMQLPERGVRTKNRKAAVTYLLDIPELMDVVQAWDRRVRAFSPEMLWYATLSRDSTRITETIHAFDGRDYAVRQDVRLICELAGVPYQSPHKLRHGHVVYALKRARNMGELKAISQNVMHASVTITDQIYGGLAGDDVKSVIAGLGRGQVDGGDVNEKLAELIELLKQQA